MRAVVCAGAIFTRFIASARMRVPMRWELLPGHGAVDKNWKGPRPKFTDYGRDRRSFTLTAGLLVFTACIFLVCMFDTGWDVPGQRLPGSGSTLGLARPGRALQSNYPMGEAWQKAGALHGMGVTFRLGSRMVNELVVAHLAECTTAEELRMFLRTLHRSGVTARADVVLLFPWSVTKDMTRVIDEEERSFQQLMLERKATAPPHSRKISKDAKEVDEAEDGQNTNQGRSVESQPAPEIRFHSANGTISPFNAKAFWRSREERKVRGEMIWENTTVAGNESDEMASLDWADWGSIVGFEMQDLDQGEVLEGFIEDPPAQLRRWTCYQMLLGMMKARYRTVLLTEVRGVFILRDVLSAARKKAFDTGINLYQEDVSWSDVHTARKKRLSTLNSVSSSGLKDHEFPREISIPNRKQEDGREEADTDRNVAQVAGKSEFRPDAHIGRMDIAIASQEMHFIEEVYGKEVWKKLDKEDKDKATLHSGFVMGNMRAVRKFSSAMLTEIAALAIKRNSRQPFHDQAVLNHLVQKSSILSRRVTGKLHMLSNSNGPVHSLPGSKQARVFFRDNGRGFAAILGLKDELLADEQAMAISKSIRDEICSSRKESWAYEDCSR